MWKFMVPVGVLAGLAAVFYVGLYRNPGYIPSPFIGKPAPGYELPSLADPSVMVSSSAFAGKVALVNVWGTWCGGCREEHSYLLTVARTSGVPIYGIDWQDDRDSAIKWLSTLGNPYVTTGFDSTGKAAIDWGVYGAPETFLIGRDGTVLYKHIAPLTPDVWQKEFVPRIEKECGSVPCPAEGETQSRR
jgi:cytochrome c biogenesis protein CcmG/thiol:disulfide interchange protein DsbE